MSCVRTLSDEGLSSLDQRNFPVRLGRTVAIVLALLCVVVVLADCSAAVERLPIDCDRDANNLPYKVELLQQRRSPLRRGSLPLIAQTLDLPASGRVQGIAVAANPQIEDGTPAHVNFLSTGTWVLDEDHTVDLTLSDFTIYFDSALQMPAVAAAGYRHDSAFVCRVVAGSTGYSCSFIMDRCDRTLVPWFGLRESIYTGDIDHDGSTEAIFLLGSSKDLTSKHLCCVDMTTMMVEWNIPFPFYVTTASALQDTSSGHTVLNFVAHNAKPGIKNPSYADLYGHLLRVNDRGDILSDRIISKTGDVVAEVDHDNVVYISHMFPFVTTLAEADTASRQHLVTALTSTNQVLFTITSSESLYDLWLEDYDRNGTDELFTLAEAGVVRVYDAADNHIIAESDSVPTLGSFCGRFPPLEGSDSTLAFASTEGLTLYSSDFRKLAVIPTKVQITQALSTTEGRLTTLLVAGSGEYVVARLHRRPFLDRLAILYFDYRQYIVGVLSCLGAGLIMLIYYSRRLRRQKREIEIAHLELTATHQALKEAQAQLVEQEKFALAQSIAGSFAHEIRNALFPADVSIAKIHELVEADSHDHPRLARLIDLAERAITRAVSLTNLISQYTKLESQYLPEPAQFASVLQEVLSVNTSRIEDQGVTVTVSGADAPEVAIHPQHLYIVLNNLLLNALDALKDRPEAAVSVSWHVCNERLQMRFADNGCGVPASDRSRIFEAFYSTKPNTGSGLGLAIVKRLVEMYGGTIALSEQPGFATVFELSLRLWDANAESRRQEPQDNETI